MAFVLLVEFSYNVPFVVLEQLVAKNAVGMVESVAVEGVSDAFLIVVGMEDLSFVQTAIYRD